MSEFNVLYINDDIPKPLTNNYDIFKEYGINETIFIDAGSYGRICWYNYVIRYSDHKLLKKN